MQENVITHIVTGVLIEAHEGGMEEGLPRKVSPKR